jgi:hypothetical protein
MYIRLCKDQEGYLNRKNDIFWSIGFTRIDRWKRACDYVAVNSSWALGLSNNLENMNEEIIKPEMMTFNQWLQTDLSNFELRRGRYYELLNKWLKVFRRDQLFIVNFKTLITDTTVVVQKFYKYLNLNSINVIEAILPTPNDDHKVKDTIFDCKSVNTLHTYFTKANEGLLEILQSPKKSEFEPDFGQFDDPHNNCIEIK